MWPLLQSGSISDAARRPHLQPSDILALMGRSVVLEPGYGRLLALAGQQSVFSEPDPEASLSLAEQFITARSDVPSAQAALEALQEQADRREALNIGPEGAFNRALTARRG